MRRKSFSFPVSTLVGSNLSNIRATFRYHKPGLKYCPKMALTLVVVCIFELLHLWERIRWRKEIKAYRLEKPPVFIIGFWRSGTTLLHNLICQDPEASYTTTLHAVFPHMVLSQKRWLRPLINLMLPALRPFDNVRMDMDFPQEEEYGMVNLQPCSLYNFFQFPGDFDDIVQHEITPVGSDRQLAEAWAEQYRILIAKAGINTGGKRYISKNPCNLARIGLIRQLFPGAKFIFIYRNPYRVVESLYRFFLAVLPGTQLQDLQKDFSREKIVQLYVFMMQQYRKDKTMLPEQDLVEIRMEDFLQDKMGIIGRIYQTFEMDSLDAALLPMQEYLRDNAGYSRESYEIHQDTYRLVNQYASDIVLRLGYPLQTGPGK